ncbi:MAG: TonB-dependent receptor, partial [Candidatus Aminicenantes bacterium]
MNKNFKILFMLMSILLIASFTYSAQAQSGTLKVMVIDDEGNFLPGVSLTLSSPVMMGTKAMVSNMVGEALFVNLTPGIYEIKSTLDGFQEKISAGIAVSLDRQTLLQIELKPAVLEESVTVTAVSPAIDTTKSVIAEHVTHETVESLPIARDFVGYLQLAAGVNIVPNSQGRDTPEDPAGKGGLNYKDRGPQGIGGKRGSRDNLYFLDGMNITGLHSQTALMTFNNEVIQEQELMTSGVPAEYGGGKGVIGNIVTKSGGNRFSGSVNFYAQPKSFFLPYGGKSYNASNDPTRLEGYKDNMYDTAFTLGGPVMRDRLWFFVSGQYRNNSSKFNLSEFASSERDEVEYAEKRSGLFGKLSFRLTASDSFTFLYFLDHYDLRGSRDVNTIKIRQPEEEYDMGVYSGYYQKVIGNNFILDFRYGHYWLSGKLGPRYPEAGVPDTLIYLPETFPAMEDYMFGGYSTKMDNKNTRDQFSISAEWYTSHMRFKAGLMYSNEFDEDDLHFHWGEKRNSLDPNLVGMTWGEIIDTTTSPMIFDMILPKLNTEWGPTSEVYDLNGDGVVTEEELRQATFFEMNEHGLNYLREFDVKRGVNKVRAMRWIGYLMDDWKINEFFTLNVGVRVENHRYRASTGETILDMENVFLPRLGLVWNIGGRGTHKLTAFYGHFSDPMPFTVIHFAGNISGRVKHFQVWLNKDWYTYRETGKAEFRMCAWTPNTKDSFSREFSLTHEIDLGYRLIIASQIYYRGDRNIVEDYDLFSYVGALPNRPHWSHLALTYADFGFGPEGPTGQAMYFLSNLIGAKRDITGFDFEISRRFFNGSYVVGQYSFKHALGNSQSDGNLDLQGDFVQLDPRNPWMWGATPGTIAHKVKIFGTYRTAFGLDIGALL